MLRLTVVSKNGNTYNYQFNTQNELDAFVEHHQKVKAWGDGHTIHTEDISAQIEIERMEKEAKRIARISRVDQLKSIDWATLNTVAEIKGIVKLLVKEAIKDDE